MYEYGLPALFAIFVWWFSTGVIIFLDNLPRHTFRWSMLGATVVLIVSLYGLSVTAAEATVTGAYLAFTFGLLAWGWQQLSFYTGYITGTRKTACPEGCRGWKHFVHGVETCIYHELAIIAGAILVFWLTWGQPNQIGTWTFMVLWWMHQSAKLNVFLGVRNLNEEFLPEHFEFLKGFLTKRPMNLLFPVSVTISTVIGVILVQRAIDPAATPFEAVGFTFLAVLMALAILEHWFLVVPIPAAVLWHWGLKSRRARKPFDAALRDGPARDVNRSDVSDEHAQDALGDHDSARSHPTPDGALEPGSWSARLGGPYDQQLVQALITDIAQGAFGRIKRLKALGPTETGWLRFDVLGGRASVTAYTPSAGEQPRVMAIGQQIDGAALEAAFAACGVTMVPPTPVSVKTAAVGAVAAE